MYIGTFVALIMCGPHSLNSLVAFIQLLSGPFTQLIGGHQYIKISAASGPSENQSGSTNKIYTALSPSNKISNDYALMSYILIKPHMYIVNTLGLLMFLLYRYINQ